MKQSTYNSLKSFIWGIANDCLVDIYDVGDYRKVILPMLVIRRFDALLETKKVTGDSSATITYFFNTSKFTLHFKKSKGVLQICSMKTPIQR